MQPDAGLQALQVLEDMFEWLVDYDRKLRAAHLGEPGAELGAPPTPSRADLPSLDLPTPASPTSPDAAEVSILPPSDGACAAAGTRPLHGLIERQG